LTQYQGSKGHSAASDVLYRHCHPSLVVPPNVFPTLDTFCPSPFRVVPLVRATIRQAHCCIAIATHSWVAPPCVISVASTRLFPQFHMGPPMRAAVCCLLCPPAAATPSWVVPPCVLSRPWTPSSPNFPCGVPNVSHLPSNAQHSCCRLALLGSAPVGFLGRSHPSSPQPSKWGPRYLPPSAARVQISHGFHPKLPHALLFPDTNGVDRNPKGPAGDNDCTQNDDGVQTPCVKCKVPDVGNLNNANHCDAQGLQSNFDRHPLIRQIPALTRLCLEKLFCNGHVGATSALWQDWFGGNDANF
jgi:hypothetical protein